MKSHSILFDDFSSKWYSDWSKNLKQTPSGKGKFALKANKFWQNAVMVEALHERGVLKSGKKCIGFGVGKERLPALFASIDIKVTATDQDFTKEKAKQWNNDQLAQGAFSLNEDNICDNAKFDKNVEFLPLDMKSIAKRFYSKYDFLWSNCALGHLGSINSGLKFIEDSLKCLKPGGWAVHTTEINIVSNNETVSDGPTVIFRLGDIYELCKKLSKQGVLCSPFLLTNGESKQDQIVSLDPEWGTDSTKILIGGHIATQALLIFHVPSKPINGIKKLQQELVHVIAYKKNLKTLASINASNKTIRILKSAQGHNPEDYLITPVKSRIKISKTSNVPVVVEYKNDSTIVLTGVHTLFDSKPLVLGTDDPVNHNSLLADNSWHTPNRPSVNLFKKSSKGWEVVDYVKPGQVFGYVFNLSKNMSSNTEAVSIIQEGGGIVPNTKVKLETR